MKRERDILVIDDEPIVTQGLMKICLAEDLTVDGEGAVSAALDRLTTTNYRLIICDVMMPGLNGFQFLAEVARRDIGTPVVMTTGYSTVENAVQSLRFGAVDIVPKPFTTDEMLAVIHRGLAYGRLRDGAPARPTNACAEPRPNGHRLGHISWVAVEPSGSALVGVCDMFVKTLGKVHGVELSEPGSEVVLSNAAAVIVADSSMRFSVMSPISGTILEVNPAVIGNPASIESNPYAEGWFYRVLPSDLEYDLRCLTKCEAPQGPSAPG